MHIIHPQLLLMLIPAAAGLYLLARRKAAYRPWPHLALRMLIATAAVLAAAGVQMRRPDYSAERFFLLDASDSAGLDASAALERIGEIARSNGVHLLTGSNHYESAGEGGEFAYYNSAFLIDPKGRELGRYDKRHLAPFGEYVPLEGILPFLGKVVPQIADFTRGRENTLFTIKGKRFCVLICFENSFPHLVRRSAGLGADFLVQLTNDGWFGRSSQPKQDLAIAAFRAVENGVTLIRGTNTGISCFIDPWGRISNVVRDPWGETVFARGISLGTISTVAHDTFYKTYGDIWVLACAGIFAAALGPCLYRRKRTSAGMGSEAEAKEES